jgi:acyl carrier protein
MERNIKQQVVDYITTNFLFGSDNEDLDETDSLLESGIIDSTGVLEFVAFIEETYGITVEDEEIVPEKLDSIANIVNYLEGKLSHEGASA